jgi:hypothetical protein
MSIHKSKPIQFILTFDKASHTILLYTLSNFGLSDRYANWFQSYLSSRFSVVRTSGNSFPPFSMLSGVPQGSTSEPLLFRFAINSLCPRILLSKFLLFANDLKIFHVMKFAEDCKLLQSDIDYELEII